MKNKCPLCTKRAEDTQCSHTRLTRHGYWSPDGRFYLSDSKGMREQAKKDGIDPEQFIERNWEKFDRSEHVRAYKKVVQ